jgi:hypothetical protein
MPSPPVPPRPESHPEKVRAWQIFWVLLICLIAPTIVYILAHQRTDSSARISNGIQNLRQDITTARKFLENPQKQPTAASLEEQLAPIAEKVEPLQTELDRLLESTQLWQQTLSEVREKIQALPTGLDPSTAEHRQRTIESLQEVEEKLQSLPLPNANTSYFWDTPPLLWVEILFWAWVGTILYLLSEIYAHYPDERNHKFVAKTPWYAITLLRGTFIVFILLLGLTRLQLGNVLNFETVSVEVYIFLAGTLGYFNRVAKEQLKLLMKNIFPDAWTLANPDDPAKPLEGNSSSGTPAQPPVEELPDGEGNSSSGTLTQLPVEELPDGEGNSSSDAPTQLPGEELPDGEEEGLKENASLPNISWYRPPIGK